MSGFSGDFSGLDGVLLQLQRLGQDARTRLAAVVEDQAIALVGYIQADKLSGQVLNVRSGVLRNSVHHAMDASGDRVVATVGTDVVYAAIHEYGGTIVPKTAQALRFVIDGKTIHAKSVTMPERSYLRSALSDRAQAIRDALAAAVAATA